jgi:putative glycosyltransferase (TIGR04372 family)
MRISHHISAIKNKGINELYRKIKELKRFTSEIVWFVIFLPFSACLVLIIRVISPFIIIRISRLISNRIGHYSGNTDMYLCEKSNGINHCSTMTIDIWFDRTSPCNLQLRIMLKRMINIYPRWLIKPVHVLNNWLPGGDKYNIPKTTSDDRDVLNLIHNSCSTCFFEFTEKEEARGRLELKKLGIKDKSKFVCLIVRDSAYLEQQKLDHSAGVNWSYHDYRDSAIENYELAAKELVRNGYYVIRMGAKVNKKMNIDNPMIIDYATNGMRSDFMDVYLGAKCNFCISTSTGFDSIPRLFRRPVVVVNNPHIEHFYSFLPSTITIFKKIRDIKKGEYLSIKSIINDGVGGFTKTNQFVKSGLELIENTPEEIKDVVVEMILRLNAQWEDTWYDDKVEHQIESIFNGSKLHGKILSRFGSVFLKENPYLLDSNSN